MSSVDELSEPPASREPPLLAWEDAEFQDESANGWWLARAVDAAGARDYFIVEDKVAGSLVGVARPRQGGNFKVIAATVFSEGDGRAGHLVAALALTKEQVSGWWIAPREDALRRALGWNVLRWRLRRAWLIARANFSLAMGAFTIGVVLGFAVAMFAVSSGADNLPILIVGVVTGTVAGTILKLIADHKPTPRETGQHTSAVLSGSWERFAVVSLAALIGAGIASASVLVTFWY